MQKRIALIGPDSYAGGGGKYPRAMDRLAKLARRIQGGTELAQFEKAYSLYWELYRSNLRSDKLLRKGETDILNIFKVKKQVRSVNNGVQGASTNDFVFPHAKVVLQQIEEAMDDIIRKTAKKHRAELEALSDSGEDEED
jgi:hypothetical protein